MGKLCYGKKINGGKIMAKIHEEVIQVIKGIVDDIKIKEDDYDTIFKDLGIDSLDTFNVLLEIEEIYNIDVPEEDVEKLNTVNSIVNYINKKSN
jgi:acyl carrier protein